MSSDKELCQRKPRLYQVALELSKFDDPYKALDMLVALVGPTKELSARRPGHENKVETR